MHFIDLQFYIHRSVLKVNVLHVLKRGTEDVLGTRRVPAGLSLHHLMSFTKIGNIEYI